MPKSLRICGFITAIGLSMAVMEGSAHAGPGYEPMDIYRLASFGQPQMAPDGRHVIWTRTIADVSSDRPRTELWLAKIGDRTSAPLPLSIQGRLAGPSAWAPDGRTLAVIARDDAGIFIRLIDIAGRTVLKSIALESAPDTLSWSPDGARLGFTRFVEALRPTVAGMPMPPAGAKWAPPPRIITAFHYREDGNHREPDIGIIPPGRRALFMVTLVDGAIAPLALPADLQPAPDSRLAWAGTGAIVVASMPKLEPDMLEHDLYLVPVDGTPGRRLTDGGGTNYDPSVSPDGKSVAYVFLADRPSFYTQPTIMVKPIAGGTARPAWAGLDRHSSSPTWSSDGRALNFLFNEQGEMRIANVPPRGAPSRLGAYVGKEGFNGAPLANGSFSEGGGVVAYAMRTPDKPGALVLMRGNDRVASFDPNPDPAVLRDSGRVEHLVAKAADGTEIEGWLRLPPGFDPKRRYPLILQIHGGPNQDFCACFSFQQSLYAARDYIVLFTNPRGSRGYGDAFANAIDGKFPDGPTMGDMMSVVDAVVQRPYVDSGNLFVTGASAGGVLTAWTIGKTSRFRAAAPEVGAYDWVYQSLASDGGAYIVKYWMGGEPWADPMAYWRRSPLSLVGNVATPTMIIAGDTDYRTPAGQAEVYFSALKLRGVDAMLFRLPESGHSGGRPSQKIATILATLDWFDRHKAPAP